MNSLLSFRLYDNSDFYAAFKYDLANAQRSVIIESPFITSKRMNSLLPVLSELRQRGVNIVVNTRSPDEHDYDYTLQAIRAMRSMQRMGVCVLCTDKHHRKLAVIDGEILWEGSLNILSQSDGCEIMQRTVSRQLANDMVRFVGADRWP